MADRHLTRVEAAMLRDSVAEYMRTHPEINQSELALRAGLAQSNVSRIVRRTVARPMLSSARKLAAAMELPLDEVIGSGPALDLRSRERPDPQDPWFDIGGYGPPPGAPARIEPEVEIIEPEIEVLWRDFAGYVGAFAIGAACGALALLIGGGAS